MKKKKLELKKKVIAALSDVQKAKIMGGDDDAVYTTSFTNCTHFICCGDTCSVTPDNCATDDSCGHVCASTTCPSRCPIEDSCNSVCCSLPC